MLATSRHRTMQRKIDGVRALAVRVEALGPKIDRLERANGLAATPRKVTK